MSDEKTKTVRVAIHYPESTSECVIVQERLLEAPVGDPDPLRTALERAIRSGVALRGAQLRHALLADADLRDADLTGACLAASTLNGAALTGADLEGANLEEASLCGADLRRVDFRRAVLRDADLAGADLREADFTGAIVTGARFERADVDGCIGLDVPATTPATVADNAAAATHDVLASRAARRLPAEHKAARDHFMSLLAAGVTPIGSSSAGRAYDSGIAIDTATGQDVSAVVTVEGTGAVVQELSMTITGPLLAATRELQAACRALEAAHAALEAARVAHGVKAAEFFRLLSAEGKASAP